MTSSRDEIVAAAREMLRRCIPRTRGELTAEQLSEFERDPIPAGPRLQAKLWVGPWRHNRARCRRCGDTVESRGR
jgi:hypothetical protein